MEVIYSFLYIFDYIQQNLRQKFYIVFLYVLDYSPFLLYNMKNSII